MKEYFVGLGQFKPELGLSSFAGIHGRSCFGQFHDGSAQGISKGVGPYGQNPGCSQSSANEELSSRYFLLSSHGLFGFRCGVHFGCSVNGLAHAVIGSAAAYINNVVVDVLIGWLWVFF